MSLPHENGYFEFRDFAGQRMLNKTDGGTARPVIVVHPDIQRGNFGQNTLGFKGTLWYH